MIMAATTNPAKGILDATLIVLFVLSTCQISSARELTTTYLSGRETGMVYDSAPQMNRGRWSDRKVSTSAEVVIKRNTTLCTLCEEFATEAVNFISENRTQTEIIQILHKSCSRLVTFEQLCITMVDYYAPLLFAEIETLTPETFCQKVSLCEERATSPPVSEDKCEICHYVLAEAQSKLKDPDSQLEIIELLLKACDAVEGHVEKCKTLVFEYGPVILAHAHHFPEATYLCAMMRACDSASSITIKQALSTDESSMLSVL